MTKDNKKKEIKTTLNINIKPYSNLLIENIETLDYDQTNELVNDLLQRANTIIKAVEEQFPSVSNDIPNYKKQSPTPTTKQNKSIKQIPCYTCKQNDRDGMLVLKHSQYGNFYGCTNYDKGCKQTMKVNSYDKSKSYNKNVENDVIDDIAKRNGY